MTNLIYQGKINRQSTTTSKTSIRSQYVIWGGVLKLPEW